MEGARCSILAVTRRSSSLLTALRGCPLYATKSATVSKRVDADCPRFGDGAGGETASINTSLCVLPSKARRTGGVVKLSRIGPVAASCAERKGRRAVWGEGDEPRRSKRLGLPSTRSVMSARSSTRPKAGLLRCGPRQLSLLDGERDSAPSSNGPSPLPGSSASALSGAMVVQSTQTAFRPWPSSPDEEGHCAHNTHRSISPNRASRAEGLTTPLRFSASSPSPPSPIPRSTF